MGFVIGLKPIRIDVENILTDSQINSAVTSVHDHESMTDMASQNFGNATIGLRPMK